MADSGTLWSWSVDPTIPPGGLAHQKQSGEASEPRDQLNAFARLQNKSAK